MYRASSACAGISRRARAGCVNKDTAMPVRIFILAFTLCLSATVAQAQLRWDNTTQFVAASPSEGKAESRFTFTNSGSSPVKITGVKTTCGCTAAVAEQRVFSPGEKGEIAVSFKTINRHGLYEEPVIVKTDDANARETELKLRVLVRD